MSKNQIEEGEATEAPGKGGKVTAELLLSQAEVEAEKGPRESFKQWAKNKSLERKEVARRLSIIDQEVKQAAADFNKGIWVAPKNQKSDEKSSG